MQQLKILKKKGIKKILKLIKNQWGFSKKLDYVFLVSSKNRIYVINRDMKNVDLSKLKIDSVGLYFGEDVKGELRLSIEGSQIIGPYANKNIIELNEKEKTAWLKGIDINREIKRKNNGFIIIKSNGDYLGCGKHKEGKILNYVPKQRRLII